MDVSPYDGFSDWESVCAQFNCRSDEPDCVAVAGYSIEGYEGDALVIYRRGNLWHEIIGSHCSCYGLEGQWDGEDSDAGMTTAEALSHYGEVIETTWSESRKKWVGIALERIKMDDGIHIDPARLDMIPTIVASMRSINQRVRIVDEAIAVAEKEILELKAERAQALEEYRTCEANVKRIMAGG